MRVKSWILKSWHGKNICYYYNFRVMIKEFVKFYPNSSWKYNTWSLIKKLEGFILKNILAIIYKGKKIYKSNIML